MNIARFARHGAVRITALAMAALVAAWLLLPALLANTALVKGVLERYLSRQLQAHVELGDLHASTWRGPLIVAADTLDVYEREGDAFVAYCEKIELRIRPLWLVIGRVAAERVHIASIEIELPSVLVHRLMLQRGYLSQPLIEESPVGLRRTLALRGVKGRLVSSPAGWLLDVHGTCAMPLLRDATFELVCVHDGRQRQTRIEVFSLHGTRHVEKHYFDGRAMQTTELTAPARLELRGSVRSGELILSRIEAALGACRMTGRLALGPQNVSLRASVAGQTLESLAYLSPAFALSNRVDNLDIRVTSETDAHSGRLLTEGVLKFGAAEVRGVPLRDTSVSFELANDQFVTLNGAAQVFNGFATLALLENAGAAGSNTALLGQLAARGIDLNAWLGALERVPATAGGELNLRVSFALDNVGIGAFLARSVSEFNDVKGEGTLTLSNAYLTYFGDQQWLNAPGVPLAVRNFLGLAAALTRSAGETPLINRLIKPGKHTGPRAITARFTLDHGAFATPEIAADTSLGMLSADGTCSAEGALHYRVRLTLNEALSDKFAEHPVLEQFYRDGALTIPVVLAGSLAQPRVTLDLNEAERREFEDRLIAMITEHVAGQLGRTNAAAHAEGGAPGGASQIEQAVRNVMRRLF